MPQFLRSLILPYVFLTGDLIWNHADGHIMYTYTYTYIYKYIYTFYNRKSCSHSMIGVPC